MMKCECGGDTRTKDSRKIEQGVWRRRVCVVCGTEFTTLEQRCETLKNPYPNKKGAPLAQGDVVVPPMPEVKRPQPKNQRARALRVDPKPAEKPGRKPMPEMRRAPRPEPQPVDRLTPTARDRIEDMKFDRENGDRGWD